MGNNISNFNSNSKKRTSKSKGTKDTLDQIINNQSSSSTKSPVKDFKYQYKVDEFAMRSLNKFRNFMSAPDCECGCGGKMMPILNTPDDLYEFCGAALHQHGCYDSAIFLVHKDGTQEIVLADSEYDEEKDEMEIIGIRVFQDQDINAFAHADAGLRLCCYGLMIEHDGSWEICE